jgi:pyruvate dehydrogenase E2 component (dihydrolipoamide acetyltransferase)
MTDLDRRQQTEQRHERARRVIAKAVSESWTTIPHFAVSRELDVTSLQARFAQQRARDNHVTLTDFLLRATGSATNEDVVGLSVATDAGVMNISVAGVNTLSFEELADRRYRAVERARRGSLREEDFELVNTTLSNLGTHGVHWFTGIIPVSTRLLLTTGAIRQHGDQLLMWVTANADHRSLDGADAAKILERFAQHCDDPHPQ